MNVSCGVGSLYLVQLVVVSLVEDKCYDATQKGQFVADSKFKSNLGITSPVT